MQSRFSILVIVLMLLPATVFAQGSPNQPSIDEVIRRFAAAESENKIARNNYTFTQDVDLMTLGEAGSITGRYKRVSDIVYDDLGNRIERITHFPPSTLTAISVTQQDLQDLAGVQPFALTIEDLPKYDVKFVGKEKVDELQTYVFDVKPKQIKKGERYFEGRVWVDDQDYQIVKAAGQGVPEDKNNKYARFETYRENIDGKYWFPTYVYADDVLDFKSGDVRIKFIIRYTNYKKFSTDIRLTDDPAEIPEEEAQPAAKPSDKPAQKQAEKGGDKGKSQPPPPAEAPKPRRKPL